MLCSACTSWLITRADRWSALGLGNEAAQIHVNRRMEGRAAQAEVAELDSAQVPQYLG